MVVEHLYIVDEFLSVRGLTEPEDDTVTARDRDGIGTLAVTLEPMDLEAASLQRVDGRAAIQILQQPLDLALDLVGEQAALALGESLGAPAAP